MVRPALAIAAAVALAWRPAGPARADELPPPFPGRGGESGLLDVPTAEALPAGAARGALELGYSRDDAAGFRPTPLSIVTGLPGRLETGFTLRSGDLPGDPSPSPLLVGVAAKWLAWPAGARSFAMALDLHGDRLNWRPIAGARLVGSVAPTPRLRATAYLGLDRTAEGRAAGAGGLAAALAVGRAEIAGEAVATSAGALLGLALRWSFGTTGLSLAATRALGEAGVRLTFGLAIQGAAAGVELVGPRHATASASEPESTPADAEPAPLEERTRGLLRIPAVRIPGDPEPEALP